jgi:YVTN family beta-propeller protein
MRSTCKWFGVLRRAATVFSIAAGSTPALAADAALQLEAKVPLGDVRGRIDHMAVDLHRNRLFVAELGNNSVGVVDVSARKVVDRIRRLNEPQGVAYVSSSDTVYVANARDGSVRLFDADTLRATGQIDLREDADNIRVDPAAGRVFVGYGKGALAVIDPANRRKIADVDLKAHPESFQLARSSANIYANIPENREIAVIDRVAGKQIASWPLRQEANFPMALDEEAQHVVVVFRSPPTIGVFSTRDGANVTTVAACGDADDVFLDGRRHRAYVSCGGGFLDVFDTQSGAYRRIAHILTASGARTALFVPELDRLLLAVRESRGEQAAIWIFRPTP